MIFASSHALFLAS